MKARKYVDAVDLPEERARDKRRKYYFYSYEVGRMVDVVFGVVKFI